MFVLVTQLTVLQPFLLQVYCPRKLLSIWLAMFSMASQVVPVTGGTVPVGPVEPPGVDPVPDWSVRGDPVEPVGESE